MTDDDKELIEKWLPFPEDCKDFDYAVRKNGWIDTFVKNAEDRAFVVEDGTELIGFSIIKHILNEEAEFLIIVRGDIVGKGIGRFLTIQTLSKCFSELMYKKIKLIVRKKNERAKKLYIKTGFKYNGECVKKIKGEDIEFYKMEINQDEYQLGQKYF